MNKILNYILHINSQQGFLLFFGTVCILTGYELCWNIVGEESKFPIFIYSIFIILMYSAILYYIIKAGKPHKKSHKSL